MRFPSARFALFATAASLAAAGPRPALAQDPASASPASEQQYAAPEVRDPLLDPPPRAATQVSGWRDAVEHLRARSADLRIAMLDATRAEAQSRVALAGVLPSLVGTARVTHNLLREQVQTTDYTPLLTDPAAAPVQRTIELPKATTYGGALTLTQPLIAPRAWHAMGTARAERDLAQASVEEKKRALSLSVADSIMAVVLAERAAQINRVGLQTALEREQLTRRRAELGAGTSLDVLRAQQDTAAARAQVISGDEALRKAREALGLALGLPQEVGVAPGLSLNDLEASTRGACTPAPSLEQRSDLIAARRQVDVQRRGVDDVWLQFAPTVDLMSETDFSSEELPNTRHVAWSIMGVLTVPLWDGGARYGLLRDARAQTQQAEERWSAARRTAQVEVEQTRRAVAVADATRQVAAQQRDLAKESERLARVAFANGKATSFELVDAGKTLREAELNLAVQEYEVVRARLAAILAVATCTW